MRLLIIEDNAGIRQSLKSGLSGLYIVEFAERGIDGIKRAEQNEHDLIILDLGLPDIPGLQVCASIRAAGITTPILVLSAVVESSQKTVLLNAGADDYLTKPFSLEELKARMRALLRRVSMSPRKELLEVADLKLDASARTVTRAGQEIKLRRKEFDLLEYLMSNSGFAVSRSMVIDHVWGTDTDMWTNAIDVHIKYLRDKVDKPFKQQLIKTVHGVGYKIDTALEG